MREGKSRLERRLQPGLAAPQRGFPYRQGGQTDLGQSPLHGALNGGVFCDPAALGGPAEGLWGRLEELFGFGEAGQVGGQAGDFRD